MNFDIKNRVITGDDSLIIGDNSDYIAEFTFDEEWNGITKTARFISCSGSYVDKILEDDKCTIPCEVLKCGYCKVGVYSSEKATTKYKFFVTKSVKNDTGCVCEPTPDVYGQLTGKLDNIQQQMPTEIEKQVGEYLEEHKEDFKGEKGDKGDTGEVDLSGYATTDYVDKKVADLINSAPEALDTLGELAKTIQENQNLIEALNVPTKTSQLDNDSGFITSNYVDSVVGNINTALETILGV